jgi:hypothetical protein
VRVLGKDNYFDSQHTHVRRVQDVRELRKWLLTSRGGCA